MERENERIVYESTCKREGDRVRGIRSVRDKECERLRKRKRIAEKERNRKKEINTKKKII